jgi:homoserine dehydrogenase
MVKKSVGVGLIGLGNVGLGALEILTENAKALEEKLGFPLSVKAISSRTVHAKKLPALPDGIAKFEDWQRILTSTLWPS